MRLSIFFLLFVCCTPTPKIAMDISKQDSLRMIPVVEPQEYLDEFLCYRALQKIKTKYGKLPEEYYEFYPPFMYPFSMIKDTLRPPSRYRDVYIVKSNSVVREYKEQDMVHIQIAVLHYTKSKNDPWARIYTLFFLYLNPVKGWQEERDPISVVTIIQKDGTYQSK
jgi:hypothetical protein